MVAVLGDQVIRISSVLVCQLLHHSPHLSGTHLRPPHQNRLPESEPLTLFRLAFENPSRGVFVSAERVLHTVNLNAGMVDTEAEPVSITIDGGEIIHIEVHRRRSTAAFNRTLPA